MGGWWGGGGGEGGGGGGGEVKGNRTEDVSWPVKVENVQTFSSACFITQTKYIFASNLSSSGAAMLARPVPI